MATKYRLWIETQSITDNSHHGRVRVVEKSSILLKIEKAAESSYGELICHAFSFEEAVAHVATSNDCGILTIEK